MQCVVGPGVIKLTLAEYLEPWGLYGPDPAFNRGSNLVLLVH
jgi:hypothetical protein